MVWDADGVRVMGFADDAVPLSSLITTTWPMEKEVASNSIDTGTDVTPKI